MRNAFPYLEGMRNISWLIYSLENLYIRHITFILNQPIMQFEKNLISEITLRYYDTILTQSRFFPSMIGALLKLVGRFILQMYNSESFCKTNYNVCSEKQSQRDYDKEIESINSIFLYARNLFVIQN